ncbi:type II secretion system secretin GspD [Parvularcula sp. LCG005]|uniref:type II secretion system secretin GspD n=1 Tax=Parvularcula sp. LCG005 TaxID=3078805 RepID=UPI0029428EF6|nr:type II secretion system secretin GspD [Parvularcula sp. LCG005]WOI54367.1 type II secretion system secretin GspD [Parvularcula sp. LCG005]
MSLKFTLRSLLAAAMVTTSLSGAALAQDDRATLNYEGADLAAVARDVSLRTKRVFVIDPRLSGRVTIISPPGLSLTPDEVWEVFLSTLQVNGFAAVPIGDREYKIVPSSQAIKDGGANGAQTSGSATVTRVVPLRYVGAQTAAANLRGLVGDNAVVTPIVESNSLIIVDSAGNVDRVLDVLRRIDVDDSVVRTVALQNAAAIEVSNTLLEIIGGRGGEAGRRGAINVVAVDSSNSIILRGSAQEVQRLVPIIQELDAKGTGQIALDTVYLNHADAEEMVPIIQQLLDAGYGDVAGAPTPGQMRPSVAFHNPTNALIINAPPEMQRIIRSIVAKLDIRRPQVQIEAVVVEISNTTARELGVQYVTAGADVPFSTASFTGTSPNVISAAGAAYFLGEEANDASRTTVSRDSNGNIIETTEYDTNDPANAVAGQLVEAAISDLLSTNGFLIGGAGQLASGSVYGVLLSAIQSDGDSNVLSVPSVTVFDNETARLQVGQEIPIVTGQATGSDFQGGFRTVERKDVGNILEVTPQINAGNVVSLKIKLELSSIGAFTSLSDDIITNKSVIETVLAADDGQTLVMGGLIDNNQRFSEAKVPLLGDIPLVGNLFKGQNRSGEEKTLMVFIRPTILRDGYAADGVTARKYDYVQQQQKRQKLRNTGDLDDVMMNYLGSGEYVVPGTDGSVRPLDPEDDMPVTAPVEGQISGGGSN